MTKPQVNPTKLAAIKVKSGVKSGKLAGNHNTTRRRA